MPASARRRPRWPCCRVAGRSRQLGPFPRGTAEKHSTPHAVPHIAANTVPCSGGARLSCSSMQMCTVIMLLKPVRFSSPGSAVSRCSDRCSGRNSRIACSRMVCTIAHTDPSVHPNRMLSQQVKFQGWARCEPIADPDCRHSWTLLAQSRLLSSLQPSCLQHEGCGTLGYGRNSAFKATYVAHDTPVSQRGRSCSAPQATSPVPMRPAPPARAAVRPRCTPCRRPRTAERRSCRGGRSSEAGRAGRPLAEETWLNLAPRQPAAQAPRVQETPTWRHVCASVGRQRMKQQGVGQHHNVEHVRPYNTGGHLHLRLLQMRTMLVRYVSIAAMQQVRHSQRGAQVHSAHLLDACRCARGALGGDPAARGSRPLRSACRSSNVSAWAAAGRWPGTGLATRRCTGLSARRRTGLSARRRIGLSARRRPARLEGEAPRRSASTPWSTIDESGISSRSPARAMCMARCELYVMEQYAMSAL